MLYVLYVYTCHIHLIQQRYHDPSGHGHINTTLAYAREIDNMFTLDVVKQSFDNRIQQQAQLLCQRESIPNEIKYECPIYVSLNMQRLNLMQ